MNRLKIEPVIEERIKIYVDDNPKGISVRFVGDIDMEDPSIILDPLFDRLHEGVIKLGIREVDADFKELNFLNSSGIKGVAKWIMKLSEVDDDNKYIIKIVHNKDITWQVTSLPTLTFLVPGAVQVE
jgi:hypothetical protein